MYLRWYRAENFDASPVVRISRDGKNTQEFSITEAPGFEKGAVYDFAPGPRGEMYLLAARTADRRHVVRFRESGEFDSSFVLEPHIEPDKIAVFASGEFLVSGRELSAAASELTGRFLLAIYDPRGQFVREISLPRDISIVQGSEGAKSNAGEEDVESVYAGTSVVTADDGNIYLMRPTTAPTVYVISPGGAVVRRLALSAPGEHFQPSTMKVAVGTIAVQFSKKKKDGTLELELFSVFDAQNGERLGSYLSTPEIGGAWVCYTADGFAFLGSTGTPRRLSLIQASPY
ncbi:MAG: hypothetical protein ACRD4U_03545 [Candidatus Acidiferrales bacterium]